MDFPNELKAELYPHHMERTNIYASTSVLGLIYDAVQRRQTQSVSVEGLFHIFCNVDLFAKYTTLVSQVHMHQWTIHHKRIISFDSSSTDLINTSCILEQVKCLMQIGYSHCHNMTQL